MRLRPIEIRIDETAPFNECKLERKQIGDGIASLIHSLDTGAVLSLEGAWGTGKTTFLKMLAASLRNNHAVVEFNAWESDHCQDPLVALLATLERQIDAETSGLQKFKKDAIDAGKGVLKALVPIATRALTAGIVPDGVLGTAATDLNEKIGDQMVAEFEVQASAVETFKVELQELARNSTGKLVVIVDELDRCRPTYAIEMLERIKHLFSVEEVIFVLGIDRLQLGESIKAVYGSGFDSLEYLRRFVDLRMQLPEPDIKQFTELCCEQFGVLAHLKERGGYDYRDNPPNFAVEILASFLGCLKVPLRTVQQTIVELQLIFAVTPVNYSIFPVPTAALLAIRIVSEDLFDRFLNGELTAPDLLETLRKRPELRKLLSDGRISFFVELWLRIATHKYTGSDFDESPAYQGLSRPEENERSREGDIYLALSDKLFYFDNGLLDSLRESLSAGTKLVVENTNDNDG